MFMYLWHPGVSVDFWCAVGGFSSVSLGVIMGTR